jgi:IMP cyclohydrolase
MYVGRTVACGRASDGKLYLFYRVNSRSFKERVPNLGEGRVSVVPSSRSSDDLLNIYVTYNCCRYDERTCVVSNGAHTDPIFEKAARGMSPRDALASVLLGMDREFDGHDTPRIALHASAGSRSVCFGVVTSKALQIEEVELANNQLALLSTNEYDFIDRRRLFGDFDVSSLEDAVEYLAAGPIFRQHEHGVLGLAVELVPRVRVASRAGLP